MVTLYPSCANSAAQPRPAGPEPITATAIPFFVAGGFSTEIFRSLTKSVAKRCKRPISIGFSSRSCNTHAPSHNTLVGHTRAHDAPRMLAVRIVRAAPTSLCVAIFLIKPGTSIPVGHAAMQGASKQYKHRSASTTASWGRSGKCRSAMLRAIVSDGSRGLKVILSVTESIGDLPLIASNLFTCAVRARATFSLAIASLGVNKLDELDGSCHTCSHVKRTSSQTHR